MLESSFSLDSDRQSMNMSQATEDRILVPSLL